MKGNPSKKKYVNYLLIPTKRINGIECPWICCSTAPNYWSAADYCATQQPTEVPAPVGLGINSRPHETARPVAHPHGAGAPGVL